MKKLIVVVFVSIFLPGCLPQLDGSKTDSVAQLRWATVNQRLVETEISQAILRRKPYPQEIYFDKNVANNKLKSIRELLRREEYLCLVTENEKEKQHFLSGRKFFNSMAILDGECLREKNIADRISQLQNELRDQQELIDKRTAYDNNINEEAKVEAVRAIELYAQNRFDLILPASRYSSANNVLYNKSGQALDVSTAVIQYYLEINSQ